MSAHNLDAALRLASAGLFVFPVRFDKRPVQGFKWQEWATNDPREVEEIWRYYRADFMPALHLGRSGLVAVDVDRHGAVDGVAAFDELLNQYGELPRCPAVETPSAGYHLVFRQPPDRSPLGNRTGDLPDGIDMRGDGGYVVACGAVRDDGCYYGAVAGWPDLAECFKADAIPTIPQWIIDIAESGKSRAEHNDDGHHETSGLSAGSPPGYASTDPKRNLAYAEAVLDRLAPRLARTPPGRRDRMLHDSILEMGGYAHLGIPEDDVRQAFWQACVDNGFIGEHGPAVFNEKMRRVWRQGQQKPLRGPQDRPPPTIIIDLQPKPKTM